MITSKQINNLLEYYKESKKMPNGNLEVFYNPDRSEILQLKRQSRTPKDFYVRFIADARPPQKVYVFDANIAVHNDVLNLLSFPTRFNETPYLILGTGKVTDNGIINLFDVHFLQAEILRLFSSPTKLIKFYDTLFNYKWEWCNYYIKGLTSYLDKEKEQFEATKKAWLNRNK